MTNYSKYGIENNAERNDKIKKLHKDGVSVRELADRFGLSKHSISKICHGRPFNHVRRSESDL
jgi:lambda repressor-like predicted transcriptional regulator